MQANNLNLTPYNCVVCGKQFWIDILSEDDDEVCPNCLGKFDDWIQNPRKKLMRKVKEDVR